MSLTTNKKRKLQKELEFKKLCSLLSPNNIVFDILPYYLVLFAETYSVYRRSGTYYRWYAEPPTGHLFGYFKLDGLRNIWMIFRSIEFEHCLTVRKSENIYINPIKLQTMSLVYDTYVFERFKKSRVFANLIRLDLTPTDS